MAFSPGTLFMSRILISLLILVLSPLAVAADQLPITDHMRGRATDLMEEAQRSDRGYEIVESLTTEVGPRLAGTEAEQRARDWAVTTMESLGFSNIRVEPFELPVWTRGLERAEILAPYPQALTITALGGSTSTGPEGIEGELVSLPSLAALKQADTAALKDKIVYIDEVMTRTQDGSGYGVASAKRREAAYIAQQKGALAALIRSVGTSTHRFAHTGQMRRVTDDNAGGRGVPAAALAAPDADQLRRVLARGQPVRLKLLLTPQLQPGGSSGNVVAEIPGREAASEIVLVGAHLDSWDLGTGAVDDGAGVGIVLAAAKLVRDSFPEGLRRTVRIVLFGAEEVGLAGAKAYAELHQGSLANHVLATESDFGAGRIWRFDSRVGEAALPIIDEIVRVLHPLGVAPGNNRAYGGPDMKYIREAGVPVVGLKQNGWDYFDLHHTPDDTLDKIAPADLAQNVAAYAAFIYLAAESDVDFR
jgi:Peptidase family M28